MSSSWVVFGVILIASALVLIVVAVIRLQRSRSATPAGSHRVDHTRMPQYSAEPTYGWSSGSPAVLPPPLEEGSAVTRIGAPSAVFVEESADPYQYLQEQIGQLTVAGYQYEVFYMADTDTMCVVVRLKIGGVHFNDYGEILKLQDQTIHIYFYCDADCLHTTGPWVHCETESASGNVRVLDISRIETSGCSMFEIANEVKQMVVSRAANSAGDNPVRSSVE